MSTYTIVVIEDVGNGYVDTWTYDKPEYVAGFFLGRDIRRYAVFKDYHHVQLPIRPLSTDNIVDILKSYNKGEEGGYQVIKT